MLKRQLLALVLVQRRSALQWMLEGGFADRDVGLAGLGWVAEGRTANLSKRRSTFRCTFAVLFLVAVSVGQLSPSEIFRRVRPSTVLIYAENSDGENAVQGSGFIVATNRIVTNYHVVAGTSSAYVIFSDGGSSKVSAVVAESPSKDLILLAAESGARSALTLGDEMMLHEGDPVLALGSPEGLQFSITDGIVSGFRDVEQQFLIQTTAPIAHGSSGGPLLNRLGQVVGITSSMLSDTPGIYFSIGVGDLKRLMRTPQLLVIPFSQWASDTKVNTSKSPDADIETVRALIDGKKYTDARTQLQALLTKHPNDANLHSLMGRVADDLGDLHTADAEFAKATSLDPKDAAAHAQYAIVLLESKKYSQGLVEIQAARQIKPGTLDGLAALLLYANAKSADAAIAARSGLAKDPKDELSLEVMAATEYQEKPDGDAWRRDAARLAEIDKTAAWVLIAQGFDEFKANHRDAGIAAFEAAKKEGFPDSLPYTVLASVYVHNGELEMAEQEVAAGLSELPGDPSLLRQGVFIALLQHKRLTADARMSELQQRATGSPDEAGAACLYYYGTNQAALAMMACRKSLDAKPDNHTAHSNYGWAALDANQFDLAVNQYGEAVQLSKGQRLTALQEIDLAWGVIIAKYYSGDRRAASELLQALQKEHPTGATLQGLQQLPLVWSDTTLTRIREILQNAKVQVVK